MALELYQLSADIRDFDAMPPEDLTDDQITLLWRQMKGAFDHKVEELAKYILELDAEETAFKEEAKRLRERADEVAHKADRLRSYIKQQMEVAHITKTKGLVSASIRNNPPAVIIADGVELADEWLRPPAPREPDKTKIKEALKGGAEIEGCFLKSGTSLQIK